ncbi:hypothetical protein RFI_21621 [Reticulomyxa filosa]|uniref:Uncharacterized protein n=1 Tax=Reticulomyxa filosa TaxID=46433 RepID=X6MQ01_RETFI|nr:hypothetical protein RFI_21621 [Reticulomyxa filosa]|eukprot:ETO15741.1 hypothetical protein RFI_21621 [Reticulomyxa filosa]
MIAYISLPATSKNLVSYVNLAKNIRNKPIVNIDLLPKQGNSGFEGEQINQLKADLCGSNDKAIFLIMDLNQTPHSYVFSIFFFVIMKQVLATKVQDTMLLHPGDEDSYDTNDNDSNNKNSNDKQEQTPGKTKSKQKKKDEVKSSTIELSLQVQDIDNVFRESKVYFEYIIFKDMLKRNEYKQLNDVIFKVQIHYVRRTESITRNKKELLNTLYMDLLAGTYSFPLFYFVIF